mmetsp:Transcript_37712/g.106562  ORF Transcript_37712/g.106562 Transcript_37712/m.106562 type:complete len:153 (+) Transcript_37712:1079-1537(+)
MTGHTEMLVWARENNCPWNKWTCFMAAAEGHLEVLQYARRHGCPWDEKTLIKAAARGHLEVLSWAVEAGCKADEDVCAAAADAGQLAALKLLRELEVPWNAVTVLRAAQRGHDKLLRWAADNGCPLDDESLFHAKTTCSLRTLNLLYETFKR